MKITKNTLKKSITVACSALLMGLLMTGCSSSTSTAEEPAASSDTEKTLSDVYGKVTKVEGNTITVSLGELSTGNSDEMQGKAPDGTKEGGQAPKDIPEGEAAGALPKSDVPTENTEDETTAENSEGQLPTDKPKGGAQQSMPVGMDPAQISKFTENGEELTINIEYESLIHIQTIMKEFEQGSLADITTDSILFIDYDENNNISSVNIQQSQSMQSPPNGKMNPPGEDENANVPSEEPEGNTTNEGADVEN